jgi:hypothetical protein
MLDRPSRFAIGGTLAFNKRGQILTVRTGQTSLGGSGSEEVKNTLLLIDPVTLKVLASTPLPSRQASGSGVSFAGGGYFYLDNLGRAVCITANQEIRIYSVRNNRFRLDQTYQLSAAITIPGDLLNSVLPDSTGNLWFISEQGVVGYVNPGTGAISSTNLHNVAGANPNETNTKSFSTDESGGVFIVSDYALYRFQVGAGGAPQASWRTAYDRGTRTKSGQNQQGSGTTPTCFDDFAGTPFVAIADNADPFLHVNVYDRRTGVLVAQQAVFGNLPFQNSCENSLVAVNHSVLIENNYGNSIVQAPRHPDHQPGVSRIDFDPVTGGRRGLGKHPGRGPVGRVATVNGGRPVLHVRQEPAGLVLGGPGSSDGPGRFAHARPPVGRTGRRPGDQLVLGPHHRPRPGRVRGCLRRHCGVASVVDSGIDSPTRDSLCWGIAVAVRVRFHSPSRNAGSFVGRLGRGTIPTDKWCQSS